MAPNSAEAARRPASPPTNASAASANVCTTANPAAIPVSGSRGASAPPISLKMTLHSASTDRARAPASTSTRSSPSLASCAMPPTCAPMKHTNATVARMKYRERTARSYGTPSMAGASSPSAITAPSGRSPRAAGLG